MSNLQLFRPTVGMAIPSLLGGFFEPSSNWFDWDLEVQSPDVTETEDEFSIALDLPGFDKAKIEVACEGRFLSVSAERGKKTGTVKYERRWLLPDSVDAGTLEAEFKDRVLTVSAKKLPESKTRKIAIK